MLTGMMRFGNETVPEKFDNRLWESHPMIRWGSSGGAFWLFGILWIVTWVLVIIALIVLIRWLWKKGDKVK